MRRSLPGILALAAMIAAPAALAASYDALSLVPVEATTVGYVRISDLRTSPLTARLFAETDKATVGGEAARFMAEAGLKPSEDVDAAVIALLPSAGDPRVLVIFEGRFDPARLSAAVAGRGATPVASPFGTYYLMGNDANDNRGAVAFATSRMVIAGSQAAVAQALEAQAGKGTEFRRRSTLSRELAKLDPRSTAWLLVDVQRSKLMKSQPAWQQQERGSDAMASALKNVSFVNISARETGNAIRFAATATTDDAETRQLLEDALRGLLATWRLAVQEKAPDMIPLIRRFQVERDRTSVSISGTITAEMLQKLQEHKATHSKRSAKQPER